MANYTINSAGSTTTSYPASVEAGDVLTFNITNTNVATKYKGTMLTYTFPCDCTAEITAAGARGGKGTRATTAGSGAIVKGTFTFSKNDELIIAVGQAGTDVANAVSYNGVTGAGGGGSFVVIKDSSSSYTLQKAGGWTGNACKVTPLIIGAGGTGYGDASDYSSAYCVPGSSEQGDESNFNTSSTLTMTYGGCFSKQASGTGYGKSFLQGAYGATSSETNNGEVSYAGFGGGAANFRNGATGGGGGGYCGAMIYIEAASLDGTAATSYISTKATNTSRSAYNAGNNGEGYVKITFKTVTANTEPDPEPDPEPEEPTVPPVVFPDDTIIPGARYTTYVEVYDQWKKSTKSFIKVNDQWKEVNDIFVKVNGAWKKAGGSTGNISSKTIMYQGTLKDNNYFGNYTGDASYSLYTAGSGIKLYKAAGTTYTASYGSFSNKGIFSNVLRVNISYNILTASSDCELGICFRSTSASAGTMNSSDANNLEYKVFTEISSTKSNTLGTVTLEIKDVLKDIPLENYNSYVPSIYIKRDAIGAISCMITDISVEMELGTALLENGVVNTSTPFGSYIANDTYAKYTAGTGITLYKAMSSSYPYSVGYFSTKTKVSQLKAFTIEYERTTGSNTFYIGICAHATASSSGRLGTANFKFSNQISLTENSGTVTIDTSELALVSDDCFLGIYFYQTGYTSNTIVIKNIYYIEDEVSSYSGPVGLELGIGYYDINTPFAWKETTNALSSGKIFLKDVYNQYGENIRFTLTSTANDLLNIKQLAGRYFATTDGTENGITNAGPIYFFFEGDDTDQTITKNLIHTANTISFTISLSEFTSMMGGVSYEYFFITLETYFSVSALSNYKLTIESVSGETKTATLRLSDMSPYSDYDSIWTNARYAYDTSSTTYASLDFTTVSTDEQQLKFTVDTALLNEINSVTKATLKMKISYTLNSGSDPNVGMMLTDKNGNVIYSESNFDGVTSDILTIDVTNYISNSIDNGMIIFANEIYNLYSGAKGQVRLYEAYIELEYGGEITNNNSVYLVRNGIVNNNTIFGALQESTGITDSSSTASGIQVACSNSTSTSQCRRFSFGNKVDSSLIEKMIVKWKFTDSSIQGREGELVIGWTSAIQTTSGTYSGYTNTATNVMNLTTANTEYTVEFPTDWSGENYLSFATRSRTANNAITYYITEIQVIMKDNSALTTIIPTFTKGYILASNGTLIDDAGGYMYSSLIDVRNYNCVQIDCNATIDYIIGYDEYENYKQCIAADIHVTATTIDVSEYSYIRFDVNIDSDAMATVTLFNAL